MLGKKLLWVAKQHGHSVEVMLRMYAAWLEGATEADIHAIKKAMEKRPAARAAFLDSRTAISTVNAVLNRVTQIVIRPLKSPESGNSLAVGKDPSDSSLRNASKIKWRRGWDSNEHVRAPRINNLLFFLRPRIPSKPPPSPFVPVDSASSLETWISTSNNALCESRRRSSYHPVSGLIKLLDQHLTDAIDPSFY